MHFISEELEDYIERHSQAEPPLLAQLNKETYQKVLLPRMLSGHFQGRVLSMLSKLIRPKTILEIGTYTGYATLCLCEGMQKDGQLHTIDIKEELVDFQRKYFDKSPWGNQIIQHLGEAIAIIPTLDLKFDLVFIDADKENYPAYLEALVEVLKPGAYILADNVLWSGKVAEPGLYKDAETEALREYNRRAVTHPRLETVVLPVRDGLSLARVR